MIPSLDIEIDLTEITQYLDLLDRNVAIAAAEAIQDVAMASVVGTQRAMEDGRFTLRRDWILKGLRVEPRYVDRQELTARIWDVDAYMGLQERGGTKTPRGANLAIPGRGVRPGGASADPARIPSSKWPGAWAGTARLLTDKSGQQLRRLRSGATAIMVRPSGTQRAKRNFGFSSRFKFTARDLRPGRRSLQVLKRGKPIVEYILSPTGNVKQRLGLEEITRSCVAELFVSRFQARYADRMARGAG